MSNIYVELYPPVSVRGSIMRYYLDTRNAIQEFNKNGQLLLD